MLAPGQIVTLAVEKPAVGGRMIARHEGQIVLVSAAIPGERVSARIERLRKGVAYATTIGVDDPSADRRDQGTDPLCGGCLYAHIDYPRQLQIKAEVVSDAFARIGRLPLTHPVPVTGSPADGYRMRARLHRERGILGFFREGTHEICDCRQTRQLLPATCDVIEQLSSALAGLPGGGLREIEISENVDATDRVIHLDTALTAVPDRLHSIPGVTGVTSSSLRGCQVISGRAHVTDHLALSNGTTVALRRHVLSFFQGNRFLLGPLAEHSAAQIPERGRMIDLYAGGGLFSIAAAHLRGARATAVEGDRFASDDLAHNAAASAGAVTAVHQSVEVFLHAAKENWDAALLDPPRTGVSKEALQALTALDVPCILYVSCDVATLARDARSLVDAGYRLGDLRAFDLFPNTPHVEVVGRFEK
jgi:23S rRNA (uracil1939-C5)-methyltransferase